MSGSQHCVDQAAIALVGGDTALLKLQAAATIRAGALTGEFCVAENDDGDIVGYTLWMPPGQEIFSRYATHLTE